jgi:hypothetical protein
MKRFLGVSCAIMLIVVGMAVTVVAQQMVPFPEPSTMVLIGVSLIVLVALRHRTAHRKDDETADSR